MVKKSPPDDLSAKSPRFLSVDRLEVLGILGLGLLVVYFLAISWRKWPDPLIDAGPQWYATWRLTQGAHLYHEFHWNYGPLSTTVNAWLFRLFGTGMMVLVVANLVVYGAILCLAYVAFRKSWGKLAAFVATAVFISVFSFTRLVDVANYNYATPYANESTHGMLLVLITVFIAVRWAAKASRLQAFLLGLCGGLAAVLKPEFMLAGALLGIMAIVLRAVQNLRITLAEWALVLCGIALPTLAFTVAFARFETWSAALVHSSQAWWIVLFRRGWMGSQSGFLGVDQPWNNALVQARAVAGAAMAITGIWAAGWFINRPWSTPLRLLVAAAALALAATTRIDRGWVEVGRCFPALTVIVLVVLIFRIRRELRETGRTSDATTMALALAVLALAMLVRMGFYPRVYHFGFYQAALAGMVIAATIVSEIPRWCGSGAWGRRLATGAGILILATGCFSIAAQSRRNQLAQTQAIGSGMDRFYSYPDETSSEINWALENLRSVPPKATVLVLPAGVMVNYLSRHVSPIPDMALDEKECLAKLAQAPPDYVVLLSSNLPEFGGSGFGAEGHRGYLIFQWLRANYSIAAQGKKTFLLRRNPVKIIMGK